MTDALQITAWDWCKRHNGRAHHTRKYDGMHSQEGPLVVRRGQDILLKLHTDRKYCADTDRIGLVMTVADSKRPQFGNGTQEGIVLGERACEGGWGAEVQEVEDDHIQFTLRSPANAIIGEWLVEADVRGGCEPCQSPTPVFLLFNPWVEEDATYMEDEDHRKEYVMADTGIIYRGISRTGRPCPWNFGQFEKNVLESALYVLKHVCRMSPANRKDPVKVSRALSAGINSNDNNGVMVGNWSGNYEGGTSPTEWSGSSDILIKYYEDKAPVKYGQCWVFSGVMTSACRAIGLPCRPVTNFSSAHDTDNSLTIDSFIDEEGEVVEHLNADSVWNFHVWNECWMKRKDLGEQYSGWQIVDATPQEESDGQYRCGPTSLAAVRKGHVDLPYDGHFVYAEVNADKATWRYFGRGQPLKLISKTTSSVGKNISTKAVGCWQREDITDCYKHPEDTDAERATMKNALRRCDAASTRYYLSQGMEDMQITLSTLDDDDVTIGSDLPLRVTISNSTDDSRLVNVLLRVDSTLYTGARRGMVAKERFSGEVQPHSSLAVEMDVGYAVYAPHLTDQCSFKVSCHASVPDTNYEYFNQDDFRLMKPNIDITTDADMAVGEPCRVHLSFTNPLPVALEGCRFYVMATKCAPQGVWLEEVVEAGAVAETDVELTPVCGGDVTITACFASRQLDDVDGYLTVNAVSNQDD